MAQLKMETLLFSHLKRLKIIAKLIMQEFFLISLLLMKKKGFNDGIFNFNDITTTTTTNVGDKFSCSYNNRQHSLIELVSYVDIIVLDLYMCFVHSLSKKC